MPLQYFEMLDSLVLAINHVLKKHGIYEQITPHDLTIGETTVTEFFKENPKLSDLITDAIWPSIPSATVYHYTSRESAECILNSGFFRLTNIAKRYNEGEIITFCEAHKLNGYLENDDKGMPKYRNLIMPNTFYASFTDINISNNQENYFWSTFGACDGVRLKIEIQATNTNFRKILYELKKGEPLQPLYEITELIRNNFGLEYILKGISRLCSFYLSSDYCEENEYRVLHRIWGDVEAQIKGNEPNTYIEIPLNEMSTFGYKLNITEVHAHEMIKMPSSYVFSKRSI